MAKEKREFFVLKDCERYSEIKLIYEGTPEQKAELERLANELPLCITAAGAGGEAADLRLTLNEGFKGRKDVYISPVVNEKNKWEAMVNVVRVGFRKLRPELENVLACENAPVPTLHFKQYEPASYISFGIKIMTLLFGCIRSIGMGKELLVWNKNFLLDNLFMKKIIF